MPSPEPFVHTVEGTRVEVGIVSAEHLVTLRRGEDELRLAPDDAAELARLLAQAADRPELPEPTDGPSGDPSAPSNPA